MTEEHPSSFSAKEITLHFLQFQKRELIVKNITRVSTGLAVIATLFTFERQLGNNPACASIDVFLWGIATYHFIEHQQILRRTKLARQLVEEAAEVVAPNLPQVDYVTRDGTQITEDDEVTLSKFEVAELVEEQLYPQKPIPWKEKIKKLLLAEV